MVARRRLALDEIDASRGPLRGAEAVALLPERMCDVHGDGGRSVLRALAEEELERAQELLAAALLGEHECLAEHAQRLRVEAAVRPARGRPQRANARRGRAHGKRPESTLAKRRSRCRRQLGLVETGATGELDRLDVVVRQQFRAVLPTILRERLDPLRDPDVAFHAVGARKLRVDGVAHETVDEGMLGRAGDCRLPLPSKELLAPERAQQAADVLVLVATGTRA